MKLLAITLITVAITLITVVITFITVAITFITVPIVRPHHLLLKGELFVSISRKAVLFAFHLMASLVINSLMYGLVRATLNIPQEL